MLFHAAAVTNLVKCSEVSGATPPDDAAAQSADWLSLTGSGGSGTGIMLRTQHQDYQRLAGRSANTLKFPTFVPQGTITLFGARSSSRKSSDRRRSWRAPLYAQLIFFGSTASLMSLGSRDSIAPEIQP